MNRRTLLQSAVGTALMTPLVAALEQQKWKAAADVLAKATASGQVKAASLYVRQGRSELNKSFGSADSPDAMFLLGSISKPMSVATLLTLYDAGKFDLNDPAQKYLPEFKGEGREKITVRQLLTHVSGLPDQLPENAALRKGHAPLAKFVEAALRTPLLFEPGAKYSYSSMAILLACEIAQRLSGTDFLELFDKAVLQPLEMKRSAIGLGQFKLRDFVPVQIEDAAPEAGGGDPAAKDWDWNSPYWRKLGAPWGGVHCSADNVARFLNAFLHPDGKLLKPETARLAIRNHNRDGLTPRGLGFGAGKGAGSPGCSAQTFGHTGSTGTLCWADPATDTICVVLTSLPGAAVKPHPRQLASDLAAKAMID
jgi:CubicO group peptidase (beta-lactamase class C family)